MLETLRRAAVKTIKPLVSEDLWSRLRTVAPRRDKRAGDKCGFAAFALRFAPTALASAANWIALLHSLPAQRERLWR